MKLDLEYIDNWSIFFDLKFLAQTIPTVLSPTGAEMPPGRPGRLWTRFPIEYTSRVLCRPEVRSTSMTRGESGGHAGPNTEGLAGRADEK